MKAAAPASVLPRPLDLRSLPPRLIRREAAPRRTKIWEFSTNLHCSIIGTCLSTAELRQVLRKLGPGTESRSDHDLHATAVALAAHRDDAARQLNKVLDHRHKLAISQFGKAGSEEAIRALWREAVRRGDIPGAYWAALTHPLATQALVREVFGEVHMLSHLVGAANRADIRRLCLLETEKAALEEKLQRQQQALHEAVVRRDAQIRDLRQALTQHIVQDAAEDRTADNGALRGLISDLERRLSVESRRRTAVEERLAAAQGALAQERAARLAAETERDAMRRELDAVETALAPAPTAETAGTQPEACRDGVRLLYVGGRPNQMAPMRDAAERLGAVFLHHDGGIENHTGLLPGLVSQSDVILFPVDCISHDAMQAVKSLCRQSGKRYIPLRSASITSLLAALHAPDLRQSPVLAA
jgi:Uncharacterized protein conserved in bacteria (DUF2325)